MILFNLIATIITVILALVFIIFKRKNNKDETGNATAQAHSEEQVEINKKIRRNKIFNMLLIAAVSAILLFITQNFSQTLPLFDNYSIIFGLLAVLSIFTMTVGNKNREEN